MTRTVPTRKSSVTRGAESFGGKLSKTPGMNIPLFLRGPGEAFRMGVCVEGIWKDSEKQARETLERDKCR